MVLRAHLLTPWCTCRLALDIAHDKHVQSPFAEDAAAYGYSYRGGKLDDTMAIVSVVVSNPGDEEEYEN